MPRYFFHVRHDAEMPDHDGIELAGPEEVRAEAIRTAGEMIKDDGRHFWQVEWQMRVTNEAGETVCALRFSAEERFS